MSHDQLVARARAGDRRALDELLRDMKDLVYNLAIRMLGSPADAEDASQEILIRLVTGLESFRGDSSFRTWVYRVASNQLLTTRKRQAEMRTDSFEGMATRLEANLAAGATAVADPLLVNEAKLICTSMMLLCLDRDHRLAFILGEILELPSDEGAAVLGIGSDAYRKRLSRARSRMDEFMSASCGLVDAERPCRCGKQAAYGVATGFIDRDRLVWSTHRARASKQTHVDEIDAMERAVIVLRSTPSYVAPDSLVDGLRALIDDNSGGLLS